MEELSTEQKAKAYDEALERAKGVIEQNPLMEYLKKGIEYIFPELAESEDERIRKTLINGFNKLDKSAVWYNGITNSQVLDWLEKQANHANFRNKIQVGDRVTRNEDGVLVNLSQLDRVAKKDEKQGEQNLVNFEEAEREKSDFVSGKFIQCRKSFNEFKEDNSYWLEYIGDDTYIGRSDNILNQKFHITPRQLYRCFSQEHC